MRQGVLGHERHVRPAEHHRNAPLAKPPRQLIGPHGRAGDHRQTDQIGLDRLGNDLLDPLVDQPHLGSQLLGHQGREGRQGQRHVAQRFLEDAAPVPVERTLGGDQDDARGGWHAGILSRALRSCQGGQTQLALYLRRMAETVVTIKGRGAIGNPTNRFETIEVERDAEVPGPERIETELLRDTSRSVIAYNDSPDVGFSASVNPYRGCEHGCVYCYARPFHEYLGFSAGLDFESRILVKEDAPELLRKELSSPKWKPQTLAMSGVTDCYQPVERRLEITRRCLEVLAEFRNPVGIITKNELVTRDIDILQELAEHGAADVSCSRSPPSTPRSPARWSRAPLTRGTG